MFCFCTSVVFYDNYQQQFLVVFSIEIKTNLPNLRMSFSEGEAIESDFENETNGDVNSKVNEVQIKFC